MPAMARTPPRIRTKLGRVLTGSCSQKQASEFLIRRGVALRAMIEKLTAKQYRAYQALTIANKHLFETKHGVPAREGNCTFQSAEYVLRFGAGTMFYYPGRKRAPRESKPREPKQQEPKQTKSKSVDMAPWFMRLPGERGYGGIGGI